MEATARKDDPVVQGLRRRPTWTLGDRLRKARVQAGLSRDTLAEHLGVTIAAISKWEVGTREPSVTVVRKWSQATETELVWLVEGDSSSTQKSTRKPSVRRSPSHLHVVNAG